MLRLFRIKISKRILSLFKKERINQFNTNGNEHGLWRYYYTPDRFRRLAQIANGKLWIEANYVDGVKHGTYRTWYDNGQLMYEMYYVNGLRHGLWRYWGFDGLLRSEVYYVNGIMNGPWRDWWYKNDQLRYEGYYVNAIQEGEEIKYKYAH